ncbi:30937_t:CDS:2, partial [Racocetra persica]
YKKLHALESLSSNDHTEKQKENDAELERETVDTSINNPYDSSD